ncbi:MAG TPA: hypothetical protein VFE17_05575 [Candidatus Baltobacteraceae bacterium]|jgi:hypothetical protein|nr:hypothetical protein [Candidatus Baltobacteraceae bacterium]
MRPRAYAVLGISVAAVLVLAIEVASWAQSARFGPLAATTLSCSVTLDVLSEADRASGLRSGDVLQLQAMDTRSRVAEVFHYTPTQAGRAGQPITLVVSRGSSTLRVPYVPRHTDGLAVLFAQLGFKLFLLGLAALLLWRGSDAASLVLGIWCTSVGLGLPDAWWGALPVGGRVAGGALTALLWTCSPFLLYLVVESIARGVSRVEQLGARFIMAVLILPALIVNVLDATAQALTGCSVLQVSSWISNAAFVSSQLVIIAFFVLSYARTSGLDKQRIQWVFWAFVLSRAGVLLNLINRLSAHPIHLSGLEWVTVLIFPLGCAYAILRHRIIDVSFVLNRTLVFTVLTTVIVGIFIALEEILKGFTANYRVSAVVELGVALAIGFSFNAAHRQVEQVIERMIFRAKHEAANALRRLGDEAPFMESAEALSERAADDVRLATGAAGTAIYERADEVYKRTARSGQQGMPEEVSVDDLAFVRLRKTRAPVDLSEVRTALGADGVAFPFTIRGSLSGALVCKARPSGESYAPDEVALLAAVAHEVGAELNAIRARRQSELLDAILAGDIDIGQAKADLAT